MAKYINLDDVRRLILDTGTGLDNKGAGVCIMIALMLERMPTIEVWREGEKDGGQNDT